MTAFVIRRLLQAGLVVFLMSVIVFFGVNVIGNPVDMLISPDADQAEIERTIRALGLDRPIFEQYLFLIFIRTHHRLDTLVDHQSASLKQQKVPSH